MIDLDEALELTGQILDVWPECEFAQAMQERIEERGALTMAQLGALERIWARIPDWKKEEAGYL